MTELTTDFAHDLTSLEGTDYRPSVTWLGPSGDVTVVWDEANREKIIELIREKMKQGYTFFAIAPRKVKLTTENFDLKMAKAKKVIVPDDTLGELFKDNFAQIGALESSPHEHKAVSRVKTAEEVVKKQVVAVKRVVGG